MPVRQREAPAIFVLAGSAAATIPPPRLLLHRRRNRIVAPGTRALARIPEWSKPIGAAPMKLQRARTDKSVCATQRRFMCTGTLVCAHDACTLKR
jgi:hypothetical protein